MHAVGRQGALSLALGLAAAAWTPDVHAQGGAVPAIAEPPPKHPELRYDLGLDLMATTMFVIAHQMSETYKRDLTPEKCRWCDRTGNVDSLNGLDGGIRRLAVWSPSRQNTAAGLSNIAVVLTASIGAGMNGIAARTEDEAWGSVGVDTLIVAETVAAGLATNQFLKLLLARERPYAHFRSVEERDRLSDPDDNRSFYSGHTKLAFAAATAAGMVATMRGYDIAPVVWATGGSLAAFTGYLRIASDRHYFTDVLAGALLGIGYGIVVPYVFHRPRERDPANEIVLPRAAATSTPSVMTIGGTW